MRPFYILLATTILSGTLALSAFATDQQAAPPVKAEASAKSDMAVEVSEAYHEQLKNGSLMIGHISMALRALDYGAADIAKTDVAEALKLAKELEQGAPEVKSKETMTFGKLTHKHAGQTKNFYIPIVDEDFVVHGLETKGKNASKVSETNAVMVHTHVTLDVRKAVSGLTEAQAALDAGQSTKAEEALNGILKSAVGSEVAVKDPLQVVHDNLILAQNLLAEKQYASARFALTQAKKGLGDYKWLIHEDSQKEHVKTMEGDIAKLSEDLKKEDPGTLDKAVAEVKEWAADVKTWLTSHPPKGHKPVHPKIFQHKDGAPAPQDRQPHQPGS